MNMSGIYSGATEAFLACFYKTSDVKVILHLYTDFIGYSTCVKTTHEIWLEAITKDWLLDSNISIPDSMNRYT